MSGDERERENKIDRSRPPKVIGVEKNTQMVSPFGVKTQKRYSLGDHTNGLCVRQ